jgi:hypothetical protein
MTQAHRKVRVDNVAGRLLEAWFGPSFDAEDVAGFVADTRRLVTQAKGPVVVVTDMTAVTVLPPAIADMLLGLMRSDNPRIERHALLVGTSAVFGLQAERLFREAGNPGRRVFRDRAVLVSWLKEVVGPREAERLAALFPRT